jgi:hypothetical protein
MGVRDVGPWQAGRLEDIGCWPGAGLRRMTNLLIEYTRICFSIRGLEIGDQMGFRKLIDGWNEVA